MNFDHGISAIDTGFFRPNFDASHLIVERGRAAFVDVGTNHSVPLLLAALKEKNLAPENVDYVILTHVHLDHAGGAGALLQQLSNARAVVHPRGVRHMIDPSQFVAGRNGVSTAAEEIRGSYGDARTRSGQNASILRTKVTSSNLAGRELLCIDTPGPCTPPHLQRVRPAQPRVFPGDTFGLVVSRVRYRARRPLILPTTTPVQFEPDALACVDPSACSSFAPQADVPDSLQPRRARSSAWPSDLFVQIEAMVAIAHGACSGADQHMRIMADLADLYISRARARLRLRCRACARTAGDGYRINAQGLGVWLDRPAAQSVALAHSTFDSRHNPPMRICLNMIVKNESAVIERCLRSVKPFVHAWAISDTGSTDGTRIPRASACADLRDEQIERPWVDFSTNRNHALELAGRFGGYGLVIKTLDDGGRSRNGMVWGKLDAAAYVLEATDSGIVAATDAWRCRSSTPAGAGAALPQERLGHADAVGGG